jgi:hypothetical protein
VPGNLITRDPPSKNLNTNSGASLTTGNSSSFFECPLVAGPFCGSGSVTFEVLDPVRFVASARTAAGEGRMWS